MKFRCENYHKFNVNITFTQNGQREIMKSGIKKMKENFLTMNNLNMNPKNITTRDESIDENSVVFNINQIRMHVSMQNFKTRARMLVKKEMRRKK